MGCAAHNLPDDLAAAGAAIEQAPVSPYARGPAQAVASDQLASAPARQASQPPQATSDGAAMQAVLAELESLGTVDPATQAQLIADLRQTDPALWPMMLQTFRAGAAYKKREADATSKAQTAAAADVRATPPTATKKPASDVRFATNNTPVADAAAQSMVQQALAQAMGPQNVPLDALASLNGTQLAGRGGSASGMQLPAQAILSAALSEAQRREAEGNNPPPPVDTPVVRQASAVEPLAKAPSAAVETAKSSEASPKPESLAVAERPASATEDDWRQSLASSIEALERLTTEPPGSAQEVTRHAWLRMLYLTAGRRDDALKPIPGIGPAEQDFWREQLYALAACLDTERQTDAAKRSAEARMHLAKADARLGESGTLAVRNLAFCTQVSSYGVYEKFEDYKFKPNQPLILYAEVQNFKSEESSKGFHTALRSSYQILDGQGRRVAENDLALTEEYCRNQRRDYFLRYFLSVPDRIYDGNYTLQLTIVDTLSQKIGTSTIEFTVGGDK
ncbi:MAG: hypothetical protein C0483_21875 [Pirellula sp.]|nr:hypothetical protein [Pirellula sp.]